MRHNLSPLLCALLLFTGALGLNAQIFVNANATGNNDGSSWADAFAELQDGLDATATAGSTEVWVAADTYKPGEATPANTNAFTFPADLQLYGGFNGTETALDQRDIAANETVLSGDLLGDDQVGNFTSGRADNAYHIIFLTDTITTATVISGFTFRSGNTLDVNGAGDDRRGGAILSYGALTVDNCLFTDNFGYFGGGIYPRGDGANGFSVTDCRFIANTGYQGAGLYILGDGEVTNSLFMENVVSSRGGACYLNNRSVVFTECEFEGNTALSSTGGAIHFRSGDEHTMNLTECQFTSNSANWGGAVNTYDETSTTIITDGTFIGNSSSLRGGAIYMGFKASTEIYDTDFSNNTTSAAGGAISGQNDTTSCSIYGSNFENNGEVDGMAISGGAIGMFGGVTLTIEDSFFESNSADFGGAITIVEDSADVCTFVAKNSIFRLNTATTQAAGINVAGAETLIENCLIAFNLCNDGTGGGFSFNSADSLPTNINIVNSTIADNVASIGAGMASWTNDLAGLNVNLTNTILSNPAGDNYEIEAGTPTIASQGGNLSDDASLDAVFMSIDISGQSPLFVSSNELDYHLLAGSPCIDAAVGSAAPTFDLEGNPRFDEADIGCFEFDKSVSTTQLSDLGKMEIFPNPATEQFTFTLESDIRTSLMASITDRSGKELRTIRLDKSEKILSAIFNVEDLATGQYFLKVNQAGSVVALPFVKI